MSSLDSLDNVKYSINRFIGPVITILVGIYLYSKTKIPVDVIQANPNGKDIIHYVTQEPMFGFAGIFFVIVGIIWILFLVNVLKSFVGLAVTLVAFGLGVFVLYKDYSIVMTDVEFQNKKAHYFKEIKEKLKDIKIAQIEYKNENKEYTPSFDSLIDFIKNGKTISYVRKGVTPGRAISKDERTFLYGKRDNRALDNDMTDVEAKALLSMPNKTPELEKDLKGYQRDTVYVSVFETVFKNNGYLEARAKLDLDNEFNPDDLGKMPFSDLQFEMKTDSISRGELSLSTLLIQAIHPEFPTDTLKIGDLEDNSLKDNWSLK